MTTDDIWNLVWAHVKLHNPQADTESPSQDRLTAAWDLRAAIESLVAERDALKAQAAADADAAAWAAGCVTDIINDRVTEIIAERDAALADAERYRWLRDEERICLGPVQRGYRYILSRSTSIGFAPHDVETLDAAIDAAREKT